MERVAARLATPRAVIHEAVTEGSFGDNLLRDIAAAQLGDLILVVLQFVDNERAEAA